MKFDSILCFSFLSSEDNGDGATAGKRRVTEEDLVKEDLKKSRVENSLVENADSHAVEGSKSDEAKAEAKEGGESTVQDFILGETLEDM